MIAILPRVMRNFAFVVQRQRKRKREEFGRGRVRA